MSETIRKQAVEIRDEVLVSNNTAKKVGGVLVSVIDEMDTVFKNVSDVKGLSPRGSYDPETMYERLDIIENKGSSYLVLQKFIGIEPEGDNIITMRLAQKGEPGNDFTYSDFTPEQLVSLRGEKGDAFTFGDFTAEQLAALKGKDGKDFTYDDFTPEQLAALKGADGKDGINGADGIKGDKGDPGKGLTILGYCIDLDTLINLFAPNPEPGDAYGIGAAAPYDIYVFDGVSNDWVNNGKLSGGGGEGGGNVVLIPAAVLSLTNASTSEEILNVFGGKDNLISIVKQVRTDNTVCQISIPSGGTSNMVFTLSASMAEYTDDDNFQFAFVLPSSIAGFEGNAGISTKNGVCSFLLIQNAPNARITTLPYNIFHLSNNSTSEDIISIFGGLDKIKEIHELISNKGNPQIDILIVQSLTVGNGFTLLSDYGTSQRSDGFHDIFFSYIKTYPTIEVTRWVIKFNDTSAACEVTKKQLEGGNLPISIKYSDFILIDNPTNNDIINMFGSLDNMKNIFLDVDVPNTTFYDIGGSMGVNSPLSVIKMPQDGGIAFGIYSVCMDMSFTALEIIYNVTEDTFTFEKIGTPLLKTDVHQKIGVLSAINEGGNYGVNVSMNVSDYPLKQLIEDITKTGITYHYYTISSTESGSSSPFSSNFERISVDVGIEKRGQSRDSIEECDLRFEFIRNAKYCKLTFTYNMLTDTVSNAYSLSKSLIPET